MKQINDLRICTVIVLALLTLSGCKDDSSTVAEVENETPAPITRIHDERTFTPAEDISFISLSEANIGYEIESA
ncbi:MAG: hypothetical protein JKX67_00570, partial [Colwellia sp.]|nr:hypothetical protein [Colwellia sp.]